MDLELLIEHSPNKAFFEVLIAGDIPRSLEMVQAALPGPSTEIFPLVQDSRPVPGGLMLFAWRAMNQHAEGLRETLDPIAMDYSVDFISDIADSIRLLLLLEPESHWNGALDALAHKLQLLMTHAAVAIEGAAGGYPDQPINAKTWMDGYGAREWARTLADWYERNENPGGELQMRFVRCKITNAIMNHYPHEVGPDMVAVGKCLEKVGMTEKARMFYIPVTTDLLPILVEFEDASGEIDLRVEDRISLWALREAAIGLIRTGGEADHTELNALISRTEHALHTE
jgi:hypothetical protein